MKVINKALDILETFLSQERELGLSELAKLTGLNITTTNRIASDLVKRGYLEQMEKRGKYSLGRKFLDYNSLIRSKLVIRDVSAPYLKTLSQLVNESVLLVSWDGRRGLQTATVHSGHSLRIDPEEGRRFSMHSTGVGKAILSTMTSEELDEFFKGTSLKGYTPKTITDLNKLKEHLFTVKREGVAYDDEEVYPGVRNVAAVVRDGRGEVVGAIGVIGPSVRLTPIRMREIAPSVKNFALEISRALDYHGE